MMMKATEKRNLINLLRRKKTEIRTQLEKEFVSHLKRRRMRLQKEQAGEESQYIIQMVAMDRIIILM